MHNIIEENTSVEASLNDYLTELTEGRHWLADLADTILRHSPQMSILPRPRDIKMGTPQRCYRNASRLALKYPERFVYVEGYYFFPTPGWKQPGYALQHGWCIDRSAHIVEVTRDGAHEYMGIPLRAEYLRAVLADENKGRWKLDYGFNYGLFGEVKQRGWPGSVEDAILKRDELETWCNLGRTQGTMTAAGGGS